MKKYILLLVNFLFIFVSVKVAAQSSGIYESYCILSLNGGANTYYDLQAATSNPDFSGASLGSFRAGTSQLVLNGAQNKTYKNGGCDITNGVLQYRVYPTSGTPGSFNPLNMNFLCEHPAAGCGNNPGDQVWEVANSAVNILNTLVPGNYTLEVYTSANYQGCGTGTHFSNNGGANYKATFTVYTDFITRWNLATAGSGANQLSFGVATSGTVSYTWQEVSPGSASGSGTFSGSPLTITGLPANSVIRLSISPTNFQRIIINNGADRNRLVDVEQWGSVAWASMENAFHGCQNLNITTTDVPDLSGVSNMSSMFRLCSSLNGPQNIGMWNTSTIKNMQTTFTYASAFNQPLNTWNTAAVTDMNSTFWFASSFNQPLNNWNTAAVTYMYGMFYGTPFNQPINNWNVSGVTSLSRMFENSSFNQFIGGWTLNSTVNLTFLFNNSGMSCANYSATLMGWSNNPATPNGRSLGASGRQYSTVAAAARTNLTTTKVWTITGDAASGNNCDPNAFITTWKTDNAGTSNSTSITIPTTGGGYNYDVDWNNDGVYDQLGITGDVTHDFTTAGTYTIRIRGAFPRIYFNNGGDNLKLLNISQWGNITWTNMAYAFFGCSNLNITTTDLPVLTGVTNMSFMFSNCNSLNGPTNIGSWNTEKVTNMSYMFHQATSFNQPIGNWNTSAVGTMYLMFAYATNFNQPIGNWNTSSVVDMSGVFMFASSFNQPLGNWNTSNVYSFDGLVQGATSFNQNLGNWSLKSMQVVLNMLKNCGMDCANYSATLMGWSKNPLTTSGGVLRAIGRQYNYTGLAARNLLISTKGWTISDDVNGASSTLGAVAGDPQVCQTVDVSLGRMYTDGCNSLLMITPNGASPVSGTINTCVKIDNTVQFYNGEAYLQRHYDITPAINPTTATARITLYALQSEFDAFNAANGAVRPDLPTGPSDAVGISYLRITKYGGTGTAPGNYSGATTVINPDDADIVWNGYHWEISFNVTGFSGFFIHARADNFALPVSLLSFSGYNDGSRNKLQWTTASETNNKGFDVQRSTDGASYESIGFVNSVASVGNNNTELNYHFTDNNINGSKQYYRLKQEDLDGRSKMSQVVIIKRNIATQVMISGLYPNPAESVVNVLVSVPGRTKLTVLVTDMVGRTYHQQQVIFETGNNTLQLNIGWLTPGTYIIKLIGENGLLSAPARFIKK